MIHFNPCERCLDPTECYAKSVNTASAIASLVDIRGIVAKESGAMFTLTDEDIEASLGLRILAKDHFKRRGCLFTEVEIDTMISDQIDMI